MKMIEILEAEKVNFVETDATAIQPYPKDFKQIFIRFDVIGESK
jgi:hypothetical protein